MRLLHLDPPLQAALPELHAGAHKARDILRRSLQAFVERDAEAPGRSPQRTTTVDGRHDRVYRAQPQVTVTEPRARDGATRLLSGSTQPQAQRGSWDHCLRARRLSGDGAHGADERPNLLASTRCELHTKLGWLSHVTVTRVHLERNQVGRECLRRGRVCQIMKSDAQIQQDWRVN